MFAKGLHASGSFISIAQKETHHHWRELAGINAFHTVWERFLKTIYRGNNKIQITDVTRQWVAFFVLELSTQSCFPGYSHRQLRGFRREEQTAAHVLCLFEPVRRVTQSMGEKAWVTNRKRIMSVGIAVDSSVKGMMRSKFPTIIPSFLVLSIPMNLPKSRKRVRQRAPRFQEFHLHSPKRNFS